MPKPKNKFEIVEENGATFVYLNGKELNGVREYSVSRKAGDVTTVTLSFLADEVAYGSVWGINGKQK